MEKTSEMAMCAAKWWADKLRGKPMHDNGDRTGQSVVAMLLADVIAMQHNAEEPQFSRFQEILAIKIQKEIEKGWYHQISLGCDYGPCFILKNAAEEAGIDGSVFPFKTSMHILADKQEVIVFDGYGASPVKIFPQPEEEALKDQDGKEKEAQDETSEDRILR